jgi:hypothetical protein
VLDGIFGMPSYGEFILVNECISTLKGSDVACRRASDQERQKREQDTLLKGSNVYNRRAVEEYLARRMTNASTIRLR